MSAEQTDLQVKREAQGESDEQESCKKLKKNPGDKTKPNAKNDESPPPDKQTNNNNGGAGDKHADDGETKNGVANSDIVEVKSSTGHSNGSAKSKTVNETVEEKPETKSEVKVDDKKLQQQQEQEKEEKKANTTKPDADSATADVDEQEVEDDDTSGTLLISGGADWEMTGRKELPKNAKKPAKAHPGARNLWGPHRVCLDESGKPLRVEGVFSGCNACHSVIVTDDGVTMTFGRNDKGQLGLGDTETRVVPTPVEALKGIKIVAAACGRSHTLFLSSEGIVFSCGDNKMGQCGTNQMAVHQINTPARVAFKPDRRVAKVACGAEFSMIIDEDGKLYSFGHPENGQLGHGSEEKYFTSGNKYAYHCEWAPRRVANFIEKSRDGHVSPVEDVHIVDVACGTSHSLAVDKRGRCYSWGFGGYHRLGHSETKNEMYPRSIKLFESSSPKSGRGAARVFVGAQHSLALDQNGLLYFWGQNKSSGEATMYPKPVHDLCGWRIRFVASASRSIFVVADDTCISWGPSPTYGELGYGEGKSKSSTVPQDVKTLEGVHINNVTCGFGHTLLIARDKDADLATLGKLKLWP